MKRQCVILGVLNDGIESLSASSKALLSEADLVIGGTQQLALIQAQLKPAAQQFDLTGKLSQVEDQVCQGLAEKQAVVVLASGDPLCHGIGGYLIRSLGADQIEIRPQISSIQLAAAKLKVPWQDLKISSIHSKDQGEWADQGPAATGLANLLADLHQHDQLAVLTSPANSPGRIARMMIAEGLEEQFKLSICQRLHGPEEQIMADIHPQVVATGEFSDPNIVFIQRCAPKRAIPLLGRADEEYQQRKPDKGLITKREIRLVSLGLLSIQPKDVIWDIGAGSGAVGIEAAGLCPQGQVYGIEKNEADFLIAQTNKRQFGAYNYHLSHNKAPVGLEDWPTPDGVFIGGTGGQLTALLDLIWAKLAPGGRLVINLITLENQAQTIEWCKKNQVQWQWTQIQVSRSKPILNMTRLEALNPVSIVYALKGIDE